MTFGFAGVTLVCGTRAVTTIGAVVLMQVKVANWSIVQIGLITGLEIRGGFFLVTRGLDPVFRRADVPGCVDVP